MACWKADNWVNNKIVLQNVMVMKPEIQPFNRECLVIINGLPFALILSAYLIMGNVILTCNKSFVYPSKKS